MKTFKRILTAVLLVITFALVILVLFTRVQGKTPSLFGYQILRVATPSMEPELMVGDVILSQKIDDITTVKEGDIITYLGEVDSYKGKLITHKVVVAPYEVSGEYYLQTQGIANNFTDPEISAGQVQGKMVCSLPVVSAIYSFFMSPWGLVVVLGFLAILFINEVFSLVKLVRKKEPEAEVIDDSSTEAEPGSGENSDLTK